MRKDRLFGLFLCLCVLKEKIMPFNYIFITNVAKICLLVAKLALKGAV